MTITAKTAASELFRALDRDFIGITNISEDIFTFQSTNVDVVNVTTLKFPIALPNTHVSYSFTTHGGVCQFSIIHKNEKQRESSLQSLGWVDSDQRSVTGEFDLKESGTIFFTWDNTRQSWISKKRLTYSIQIKQQAFSFEDDIRAKKAVEILPAVREEKDYLLVKLGTKLNKEADLLRIKDAINEYKELLKGYREDKKKVSKKIRDKTRDLRILKERISGLGIRYIFDIRISMYITHESFYLHAILIDH